jgi:GNAT superfamily N-acetyltransferase
MSVTCFSVAPEYRGRGISAALLERIIFDANKQGYVAVEGYAHKHEGRDDTIDFKGPTHLYEKLDFIPVAERGGVVIMRKVL